jgi:hypothetical protein
VACVVAIMSLEKKVLVSKENFLTRYRKDRQFQLQVHKYLNISRYSRMKLGLAKYMSQSWYSRQTDEIITVYATKVQEGLILEQRLHEQMEALRVYEQMAREKGASLQKKVLQLGELKQNENAAADRVNQRIARISEGFNAVVKEELNVVEGLKSQIVQDTDATAMVQLKLKQHLMSTGLVKMDENGQLTFDEENIGKRFEQLALNDVLENVGEAVGGYIAKVQNKFEGLITSWADLEDVSELNDVDWVASAVYSRSKGYALPQYPYLIAGKRSSIVHGKTAVNSAIAIDRSGSMVENNRMLVASKAGLAQRALMRKLNPYNEVHASVYNSGVTVVDSIGMVRGIVPSGGTRTDLALEWLLSSLEGKGPGIAQLLTDGGPDDPKLAETAAAKFKNHPYLLLRIFLIDGNPTTEEIMKGVAYAAGPRTKIASIKNYTVGGEIVKDISACISDFQDITNF